ncbi:hypothetical protein DFJ74DRAFT_649324 [Hyaloraphidium curvatum]|nr:hypothetical protein DFJ74DRAFT_649324 [Hyaloraphidium curvatum]
MAHVRRQFLLPEWVDPSFGPSFSAPQQPAPGSPTKSDLSEPTSGQASASQSAEVVTATASTPEPLTVSSAEVPPATVSAPAASWTDAVPTATDLAVSTATFSSDVPIVQSTLFAVQSSMLSATALTSLWTPLSTPAAPALPTATSLAFSQSSKSVPVSNASRATASTVVVSAPALPQGTTSTSTAGQPWTSSSPTDSATAAAVPTTATNGTNLGVLIGAIIGGVFALAMILFCVVICVRRWQRTRRPAPEEFRTEQMTSVIVKAGDYQQLETPSPKDDISRDVENSGNNGKSLHEGAHLASLGNQQEDIGGGARGERSSEPSDAVEITMLDDDDDGSSSALQVPTMVKLQTAFSIGSNPSSVDESEHGETSPGTIVNSTLSHAQLKEDEFASAVARTVNQDQLMISIADVPRMDSGFLLAPLMNSLKKNSPIPDSAATEGFADPFASSVEEAVAPDDQLQGTKETHTSEADQGFTSVSDVEDESPANGPELRRTKKYRIDDERMPRMVNVLSKQSQTSLDAASPSVPGPAEAPAYLAPIEPTGTLAPRKILTSPNSGLSDLLSLYAHLPDEERRASEAELEGALWQNIASTPTSAYPVVQPESPIPTHRQLGRKGTTKTVHELNVTAFRSRKAADADGIKSGFASIVMGGSEANVLKEVDASQGEVAQEAVPALGRFDSFLQVIDNAFREDGSNQQQ